MRRAQVYRPSFGGGRLLEIDSGTLPFPPISPPQILAQIGRSVGVIRVPSGQHTLVDPLGGIQFPGFPRKPVVAVDHTDLPS